MEISSTSLDRIRRMVAAIQVDRRVPSLVVAVAEAGRLIHHVSIGQADLAVGLRAASRDAPCHSAPGLSAAQGYPVTPYTDEVVAEPLEGNSKGASALTGSDPALSLRGHSAGGLFLPAEWTPTPADCAAHSQPRRALDWPGGR